MNLTSSLTFVISEGHK